MADYLERKRLAVWQAYFDQLVQEAGTIVEEAEEE